MGGSFLYFLTHWSIGKTVNVMVNAGSIFRVIGKIMVIIIFLAITKIVDYTIEYLQSLLWKRRMNAKCIRVRSQCVIKVSDRHQGSLMPASLMPPIN